ncbi:MAG: superoxide dismutase [Crenarchaeota archaeon]|nr:superoxide dismutase [Thermoproteota archaeon]
MEKIKTFTLPKLPYEYDALVPYISEEQLKLHHVKHHQTYVNGANTAFEKIDKARQDNVDIDAKALLKDLSFNIGGHLLHSIFWENMAPPNKGGGGDPSGSIADVLNKEFGSYDRFKKEFTAAAKTVEGSGWAVLAMHPCIGRPLIMQIEKHNVNVYPTFNILMVLDVWEHAYYVDHKNDRPKFIDAFWNVLNWDRVNKNLDLVK